jgi:hypothetical protein
MGGLPHKGEAATAAETWAGSDSRAPKGTTAVIDAEVPAPGMMKIVAGVESNCGSLHPVRHGGLRSG